jgi:hypothetical protein
MDPCLSLSQPELEVGMDTAKHLLTTESKVAEPGFDPGTFGL